MTYENPEDYLDDEEQKEKKERRWSLKQALKLSKHRKTKEEKSDMTSEDVKKAAEIFYDFITPEPYS
jgi:F0F1-type ATP synthase assembly protein I